MLFTFYVSFSCLTCGSILAAVSWLNNKTIMMMMMIMRMMTKRAKNTV